MIDDKKHSVIGGLGTLNPFHSEPIVQNQTWKRNKLREKFNSVSHSCSDSMGRFFFFSGAFVAHHPIKVIIVSVLTTLSFAFGFLCMETEERVFHLWIPKDGDFMMKNNWMLDNFPETYKYHTAIYTAENVLKKDIILSLLSVHEIISSTEVNVTDAVPNDHGDLDSSPKLITWENKCVSFPVMIGEAFNKRRKRNSEPMRSKRASFLDTISFFSNDLYCKILEHADRECLTTSLLEIWGYDRNMIESLTNEQIVDDINSVTVSSVYGVKRNFSEMLTGVQKDENGRTVSATGMLQMWFTKISKDRIIPDKFYDLYFSGGEIDVDTYRWEEELTKQLLEIKKTFTNFDFQFMLSQSMNDEIENALDRDSLLIPIGYICVFIYVLLMLGKVNLVECRPLLSLLGIVSVVMSLIMSNGICAILGFKNTLVNKALPFLILALGIDDMFIIMQALSNLSDEEKKLDISTRIGCTMRHAGASILVTSITDICAFGIGALTSLPALRSFCIYASVGIIPLFILQVTFFVACLKFDEERIESKRNALFCCLKMNDWQPKIKKDGLIQKFFSTTYPKIILNKFSKIFILMTTFGFLGLSIWAVYNLEQLFNIYWFVPPTSYLHGFLLKSFPSFPSAESGNFYVGNISLYNNLDQIEFITEQLEKSDKISTVDSWYTQFKKYNEDKGFTLISESDMTEKDFQKDLGEFLFSAQGFTFQPDFIFESPLECTKPASRVLASKIRYRYKHIYTKSDKMEILEYVKDIGHQLNVTETAFSHSYIHCLWEVDKVIEGELHMNLSLAIGVIFLIVLGLLSSFVQSILVLSCVLMTLTEVGALMYWWGLTIDASASVNLILAVGLCVDYSTHIALMFLSVEGSRDQRVQQTLAKIGPAVLNGGVCTFITFIFLMFAESHIFVTFFKIFFGVVIFGLYHGLVYLPVLLSLIGPASYKSSQAYEEDIHETQKLNGGVDSSELALSTSGGSSEAVTTDSCMPKTDESDRGDSCYSSRSSRSSSGSSDSLKDSEV